VRHGILIAMGAAAVAAVAPGCFGSSARPAAHAVRRPTRVTITYHENGTGTLVRRRLGCTPPAGDYQDPAAACAALRDLDRALLAPQPTTACGCIVQVHRPGSIVGELDGRPVWLPLGAPSPRAGRDVQVLTAGT
jgi:hypothetical protein